MSWKGPKMGSRWYQTFTFNICHFCGTSALFRPAKKNHKKVCKFANIAKNDQNVAFSMLKRAPAWSKSIPPPMVAVLTNDMRYRPNGENNKIGQFGPSWTTLEHWRASHFGSKWTLFGASPIHSTAMDNGPQLDVRKCQNRITMTSIVPASSQLLMIQSIFRTQCCEDQKIEKWNILSKQL